MKTSLLRVLPLMLAPLCTCLGSNVRFIHYLGSIMTGVDGCLLPRVISGCMEQIKILCHQNLYPWKYEICSLFACSPHTPTFFYRCSSLLPRGTPSNPSPSSYPNHLVIPVKPSPLKGHLLQPEWLSQYPFNNVFKGELSPPEGTGSFSDCIRVF